MVVVNHYDPESKRQSMKWKHPQSPSKKKSETQPFEGKVMLTVFWDSQGPVLEHYQETGTTIYRARYSEMLNDMLKPAKANAEDYCRKVLCCCTTMHVHIVLPTLLKSYGNSSLK